MKRYLLYIVLTVVLSTAGCTRGQWLDEVVAQRDEQEDVVPILRAAQEKGLTVDSAEEIERTNKYYTVDTANGYYNEFKRYRVVFSDKTTVEFDVLGLFNGVQNDYYEERGLDYIGYIDLVNVLGNLVIDIVQSDDMIVSLSFMYTTPNGGENTPENNKIYYTSTDGGIVMPYATNVFGANIVSNTYADGQGVITFDGNVTKIGDYAFDSRTSLVSITIPDSVTSIGWVAFRACSSLASVTIPEGVTSIGDSAFYGCSSLASITIPEGVTSIGDSAFYGCSSLASITIPDSVTSIGDYAFWGCSSLASITIPEGVTSIGSFAFYNCPSLASITIPDSVTSICYFAFSACSSLAEVYCKAITPPTAIPNSSSKWGAFDYNASGRTIYVPEESVEAYKTAEWWSDYADAFVPYDFEKGEIVYSETQKIYYTSTDGQVVTPNDTTAFGANIVSNTYKNGKGVITFDGEVTEIGYSAFEHCSSLASITIPDSVTSIGTSAFYGCSRLTSITIPESVTSIGSSAFSGCTGLASITIPESVTSIEYMAFAYCSSLASVTIGNGVTSIVENAFIGCLSLAEFSGRFASEDGRCLIVDGVLNSFARAGLTEYTIPDGVTSIGSQAFSGCSGLASITIPEGVTSIGRYAFDGCSSLTSITIPDGVNSIGYSAFEHCSSLAEVYCKATTPPTAIPWTGWSPYWRAFDYNASDRKIYVPEESVGAYKTAEWWSEYADDFVAYDFEKGEIVYSETQKIYYTSTDGNVVTPYNSGTSYFGANIISNTYENGQGVITFDGEVTKIGYHAFAYCSSLANITIPEGVTEIGEYAFYHCKSLASVTIGEGVTSIGNSAFVGCSSLASVTIPDSVTSIGDHAFNNCYTLPRITIPESVTEVGYQIFWNCRELTEVYCKPTTPPAAVIMLNYSPPATSWILFNSGSNCKVYVPAESVEAYKTAEGWSAYADAIEPYVFE